MKLDGDPLHSALNPAAKYNVQRNLIIRREFLEPLPLRPQFRDELDEARMAADFVQVWINLEVRQIREAVIGRVFEPFDGFFGTVHRGVSRRDVVSRVVKMSEAAANS